MATRLNKTDARAGETTGGHVRGVLVGGLAAAIIALGVVAAYFVFS